MANYSNVLNTVNQYLDTPYLQTSISTNSQKKVCLEISRPENDKTRANERGNLQMANFKRKLGLKDNVIRKNNDSIDVTGRKTWSDCGTLDKGSSLTIPLEELGQEYHLFRGKENDVLKSAVKETGI